MATRSTWLLLVAILAPFLLVTTTSDAQGTSHAFPDPISSREFSHWLARTGLTDEEALVAAEALDEYQDAFRALRDGPIEAWLTSGSNEEGDLTATRGRLARQRAILKQIAALETALAMNAVARVGGSDALQNRLAHRATRRRAIKVTGGHFRGGIDADLLEELTQLELEQATRDAIEPSLIAWEVGTSNSLTKLADSVIERELERARAGLPTFSALAAAEGDSFDEAWEEWQATSAELNAERYEARNRIARETIQAVDSMKEHLPPEKFDRLRRSMLGEVYGRWFPDRDAPLRLFAEARDAFEENPDTLAAIETIYVDWQSVHRDVENRIVRGVEEERSQGGALALSTSGMEAWQARRERIRNTVVKRVMVNDRARDSLRELVGETIEIPFPDAPARERAVRRRGAFFLAEAPPLDAAGDPADSEVNAMIAISIGGPGGGTSFGGTIETNGHVVELDGASLGEAVFVIDTGDGGEFELDLANIIAGIDGMFGEVDLSEHIGGSFDAMPVGPGFMGMGRSGPALHPLTHKQLDAFARESGLGESPAAVASILHEDYLVEFDSLADALLKPSGFMLFGMGSPGADAEDELGVEQRFRHNHEVVMEAFETDRRFLLDLETALSGGVDQAELDALVSARERAFWRIAVGGGSHVRMPGMVTSREADVDLAELLDTTVETPPEAVEAALAAWSARAGPLLRERFETYHTSGLAQAKFEEEFANTITETSEDENGAFTSVSRSISIDEGGFEEVEALGRTRELADESVASLSRETITTMARELPPTDRRALERAWRRAAWPGVFLDYTAVDAQIVVAQALETLDAEQLATVATIAVDHEVAYERLSIAIIEAARARNRSDRPLFGPTGPGFSDEVEKLRFERNELNARTLRQLQQAVGAENVERIGTPVPPQTATLPIFTTLPQPQE